MPSPQVCGRDVRSGGQWWMPVPNQADGSPPPAGTPNRLVNVNGGATYLFGVYSPENETFTPWSPAGEKPGKEAALERGGADWWGGQGGPGNNGRMMIIGWATPDYGGPAGPGIGFLTRLTLLREVHYDPKLMNLVSNPVPELTGLRTSSMASEKGVVLTSQPHAVQGTGGGAASSADVVISFSGFADGSVLGACVLANSSFEGLGISLVVSDGTVTAKAGTCSDSMKADKSNGGTSFPLFDDESELKLRILPDRSLADFFVQGGRWSGTISWQARGPRAAGDSTVAVWSNSTSEVKADIDVFGMGCGWVDPSYTEHPTM